MSWRSLQGHHFAGPEVGLGMFGDSAQLLIDLREQGGDKLHGAHTALLSWAGCPHTSVEESSDDCKPKNPGVGAEYDLEGGIHPLVERSQKGYQKGVALSKRAMHAVEARLARHPELPKWDILILPAAA